MIFKITLGGVVTILHSSCETQNTEGDCLDGAAPFTALIQGTNGDLYGATRTNGVYGGGTIFKITMAGNFATLYTFCPTSGCPDGENPYAALVQGADGNFYGVTQSAGTFGGGTFFTMTPSGAPTTLYNFCSLANCADGNHPVVLMLATDGNFYGMTGVGGGAYALGTIFQITPSGSLTTEHGFDGTDGIVSEDFVPGPWLIQETSGTFYGVTSEGGGQLPNLRHPQRYRFQLIRGFGPVRENPADLRQCRVGRQNSGKQSDRRHHGRS